MTPAPPSATGALILFAHPALQKSRANRRLLAAVQDMDRVTVRDLYELYPDFMIDVADEQSVLQSHELIVFQHPFYWYSMPALLKQWLDLVLTHGWAFGNGGDALRGKRAVLATTTGGPKSSYRAEGSNRYTMDQLLRPLEQTAALCGMRWQPPWVLHGTGGLSDAELDTAAADWRAELERLLANPN